MKKLLLLLAVTGLLQSCADVESTDIRVVDLTCEYIVNPLGIDVLQPRLSWKFRQSADAKKGQLQTAYRILVASSPEILASNVGDLWDSGKTPSDSSVLVAYKGKPLKSTQLCYWKVQVWNNFGQFTVWSQPAVWSMGILNDSDWQAKWIGDKPDVALQNYLDYMKTHEEGLNLDHRRVDNPPLRPSPLLRKTFALESESRIKRASLYVSALGDYEIFLNGERIGDRQLAPEWTDYYRRVQYQTYDLTAQLSSDKNTLSATLADGWCLGKLGPVRWTWSFPRRGFYSADRRLLAQLLIEYADGTTQTVATDDTWKINPDGYILTADNFVGQTIDARKYVKGWGLPDFDDSDWANAYADTGVNRNVEAQKNEPIRVHHTLKPVEIKAWNDKYTVNFGQNLAGHCALKIKGKAGDTVVLRHGEWLHDDGSLYTTGLGHAIETDVFILSGGEDYFEPTFTYHGFQYVEISGLTSAPSEDMITALAVSSDPEITGKFECSNPKLNQLFSNILWTQRNNMHSVPTDCPQRDERCGWLGDAQVFCQNSIFNMNMAGFYSKFIRDMRDAVAPNCQFYSIVPSVKHDGFGMDWYGGPAWADAGVIIPWRMYENYADIRVLGEHYEAMRDYVESIWRENPDLLWTRHVSTYNDWLNANTFSNPPEDYNTTRGAIPDDVFNTAFFANSAYLLSKIATTLGKTADAARYRQLSDSIKAVFVRSFVSDDGKIAGNAQSAYALALHFDLLPENLRVKAFEHLIECLEEYDCRISTGFVTTPMLMKELVRYGRTDLAYRLLESERFPSWIYAVNQGATTVWERWDAYVKGRGIHPDGMNSFDHYSIGSVGEWLYRNVLGINPDETRAGYAHFTIQPRPAGGTLTWAKGSYNSIRGEISSAWKIENGLFTLKITIPVNTTATVVLPDGKSRELGSGEYEFSKIKYQ